MVPSVAMEKIPSDTSGDRSRDPPPSSAVLWKKGRPDFEWQYTLVLLHARTHTPQILVTTVNVHTHTTQVSVNHIWRKYHYLPWYSRGTPQPHLSVVSSFLEQPKCWFHPSECCYLILQCSVTCSMLLAFLSLSSHVTENSLCYQRRLFRPQRLPNREHGLLPQS